MTRRTRPKSRQEDVSPIVKDFLRYMQRYRDPAFSMETRLRNEHKAWAAFSIMTAAGQRLAVRLLSLEYVCA